MQEIENKVAKSGLLTISLEDFFPQGERAEIDLQAWLYEGLILREKEFRAQVKEHHWEQYQNTLVSVYCSEDAIIPQWAFMLIGTQLAGLARRTFYGPPDYRESVLMEEALRNHDFSQYQDKRVILKGCGDLPIPPQAYLFFAAELKPFAKTIMFGEACSTVPIYKRAKK